MSGDWTLEDAKAARVSANRRYGRLHRTVAPLAASLVSAGLSAARALSGDTVDRAILSRVSRRMNQNLTTGFDGYAPRQGDIIASAYVKAGTNWVMYMCHQIIHLGQAQFDHVQDVMPWPDAAEPRYWLPLSDPTPYASPTGYRVIKSHCATDDLPISDKAKYIAVTRDPKDCAASAYHYFRTILLGPAMPPPDTWIDHFLSDDAIFGRWDAFTASWYQLRNQDNVLFLQFEDIKADPAGTVDQIAGFLGIDLATNIRQRVVEAADFSRMKEINDRFYPVRQSLWTDPEGKIIRKGAVGDGQKLFSPDALARLDRRMAEGLARLGSDFPYDTTYGPRAVAQTRSA